MKIGFLILFGMALASTAAGADETSLTVSSLPTAATAPIALIGCDQRAPYTMALRVGNRSTYSMASVTYRLRVYDSQGARFVDSPMLQTVQLDPGEVGVFTGYIPARPDQHRVVCTVTGAAFQGGRWWNAGQPWAGKLVALAPLMPAAATSTRTAAIHEPVLTPPPTPAVTVSAKSVWTSVVYNTTYVHVRTEIRATRDVAVTAYEFQALVPLPGGGQKSLRAYAAPAPRVVKSSGLNELVPALGNTAATPLVDPSEDLGAIGKIQLHAGETADTVITFQAPGLDASSLSALSLDWKPSAY